MSMMSRSRLLLRVGVLLPILAVVACGEVVSFDVSTNTGKWNIVNFGGLSMDTKAYVPTGTSDVSVTSTAYNNGSSVGNLSQFDGFWVAQVSFLLPTGAYNAVLNFSGLYGDDRVLLRLNGNTVGNATVKGTDGLGAMSTSNSVTSAYNFTNITSGTASLTAGWNTLQLIVNNTGSSAINAPTYHFAAPTDASMANVFGTVSYNMSDAVPEPASMSFLLLGLAPILYKLRKRRSCS